METRRNFIKNVSKGAVISALPFIAHKASASIFSETKVGKPLTIGIIGAENSHTIGYGKVFNIEKKIPGAEIKYVWGETDEFAQRAKVNGNIPNIVKDPKEMLGKIDALIVDHRHGKYHLDAAWTFVENGVPTFIDKPFCYRLSEGKEFLVMAREKGTPVSSYSGLAHSAQTFDMKKQVEGIDKFYNVVRYGRADFNSEYGGIFFYGAHLVQPLLYIFGDDIEKVRVTKDGSKGSLTLKYENGLFVTLILNRIAHSWQTFIETEEGVIELKPRVEEDDPPKYIVDMVEMFRTGKEPRTHESILKCVAVLEALEKSYKKENWVKVIS